MQLTLSSRHVKSSYVGSINVRACHMNSIYISYDIGVRQFLPLYTFYMYIKTSLRLKYIQGSIGGSAPTLSKIHSIEKKPTQLSYLK